MAKSNHKDKKSLRARFLAKYRFVVLNENTFEEILSYKLSRFNVFMIVSISAIILIGATYMIIALTPLKEYIPGYDSTAMRRQAINNTYVIDSLQQQLLLKPTLYFLYYERIDWECRFRGHPLKERSVRN